ncbi:MAG: hypothetical protein AAGD18_17525 [Actinomycetota bacterium]
MTGPMAQMVALPVGVAVFEPDGASLFEWDLSEQRPLGEGAYWNAIQATSEAVWFATESPWTLRRFDPTVDLAPMVVRELPGWAPIVGFDGDDALVASDSTGSVHRVSPDGTTSLADTGRGLLGGNGWVLVSRCDGSLSCEAVISDLVTGRQQPVELPRAGVGLWSDPGYRSRDGRRVLATTADQNSAVSVIIDADELTVAELPVSPSATAAFDPDLSYGFEIRAGQVQITELATAERVMLELPKSFDGLLFDGTRFGRLLVPPAGWEPALYPPGPDDLALHHDPVAGVEVTYPARWHLVTDDLTPNAGLTAHFSLASYEPPANSGAGCNHLPVAALEALGPDDVFIHLEERGPLGPGAAGFAPRPQDFAATVDGIDAGDAWACLGPDHRDDLAVLRWLDIRDNDRGLYLLVAVGTDATDDDIDRTIDTLNSLTIDPP